MLATHLALLALASTLTRAAPAPAPAAANTSSVGVHACTPIYAAYYRAWRDEASIPGNPAVKMSDLPDGTGLAFVFANGDEQGEGYWTALRDEYVPALHAKGTKVVRSLGVHVLLAIPAPATSAGYVSIAQGLVAQYVTPWNLDGLDIDMEQALSPAQNTHLTALITALGRLVGPQGKAGSVLVYDTNQDVHPLIEAVRPYVSYVALQAYGRSPVSLQGTWEGYAPYISSCQWMVGFSFYEEKGASWGDATAPFESSRAAEYAAWKPKGGDKGGVFSYAVDRDWKAEGDDTLSVPTYEFSNKIIDIIQQK